MEKKKKKEREREGKEKINVYSPQYIIFPTPSYIAMKLNLFYFTCLNPRSSSELEVVPCIEACTMDFARDLELPGLPTRKRGIRSSMQTAIMKTFSLRAAFLAMFGPRVILSSSTSWQLWRKDGQQTSRQEILIPVEVRWWVTLSAYHWISFLNCAAPPGSPRGATNCAVTPSS